jgi:hypothetical protein
MGKPTVRDAAVRGQISTARRRAARLRATSPHARTAYYDREYRRVVVVLTNDASLVVPVSLVPRLRHASDNDLAQVQVGPAGVGLRWESLDVDVSVASLARLALGSSVLLRAAGAVGGAARTSAKVDAARRNGLRGGRPRTRSKRPV